MGYDTNYVGEFKFNYDLPASELAKVKSFLGEDCRDHPEWDRSEGLYGVDLEFLDDFSGIKWDESEKSYDMPEVLNMIIVNMNKEFRDFGLSGKMSAQGEEPDDRYEIIINDEGFAEKVDVPVVGDRIMCPHCECEFILESKV